MNYVSKSEGKITKQGSCEFSSYCIGLLRMLTPHIKAILQNIARFMTAEKAGLSTSCSVM